MTKTLFMLHVCLDNSPRFTWIELAETTSTNAYLRHYQPAQTQGMTLVTADYQTAGRGQIGNTWESAARQNLLFSLLYYPQQVEARDIFILSQAIALGVLEGAAQMLGTRADDLSVKWPNDIYYGTRKLAGILIETELMGRNVQRMIAGVGLNVNQREFLSDAPNPVSLGQITGDTFLLRTVLEQVIGHIRLRLAQLATDREALRRDYASRLYRRQGYHDYRDANGQFQAVVTSIEPDGHLLLTDRDGHLRRYAFKEVEFV